ncbi:hypothetical protein [Streptomyces sp. NPDC054838]
MTTSSANYPKIVETAMEAAAEAGWEVVRSAASVKFIPEQGKRVTLQLNKPLEDSVVRARLQEAGLHLTPEPEPTVEKAAVDKVPCPECGNFYGRGQGLWRHRRAAHGVSNTTTIPGNISGTGLPDDINQAAHTLLERISANLVLSGSRAAEDAAGKMKDLREDNERLAAENRHLEARIRTLEARAAQPRESGKDERIKALTAENRTLARFRDRVEAEVMNQEQAPIQTVVKIIKLGGHGFGLDK